MKNIGIIGSGGREHALGWKFGQSDNVGKVFYFPGNGGSEEGKGVNVNIDGTKEENFSALFDFIERNDVDLTVVGPEVPLCNGIVNFFNSKGNNRIFGPTKGASALESDKFYSYDLMWRLGIPQAYGRKCRNIEEAIDGIMGMSVFDEHEGVVIKARGLTAGKGVSVCNSKYEALEEMKKHSKSYGPHVLISERLYGEEYSIFGISDGKNVVPISISFQDHKRQFDGDIGKNTGGMGAYGPVPIAQRENVEELVEKFLNPLVREMSEDGNEYMGFIYMNVMQTPEGPKVLEFNARFGDPECQSAMMLLKSDLYDVMDASLTRNLKDIKLEYHSGSACCVVLPSRGYPEDYKQSLGLEINGLEEAALLDGVKVFHAGTKREGEKVLTSGGRVLGVTGYSPNGLQKAVERAYAGVSKINVCGGFSFRKDIGSKGLRYL